jgi:hypothetical protein
MWRWERGRQASGYRKLLLAHGRRWDLHLIDYPRYSHVPDHVDPIPGRRHVRANLVLSGERKLYAAEPLFECGRFTIFRSDRRHMVGMIRRGRSLVLSLGLSLPERA